MKPAPGLRRLSVKLGLVLFLAVAGALAIVYFAVLPQLESRLVDAKIGELERSAPSVVSGLATADEFSLGDAVSFLGANLDARIVVYRRLSEESLLPIEDSQRRSADVQDDPVALEASQRGVMRSDRVERGGREYAEVAAPIGRGAIVLVSAQLSDALSNVRLVRKSILVAGAVALLISWLAGYLAASSITRRIRRLESAAERIAGGDFAEPVVDPGHDEIAQLAAAFESMRQRLSQLDRARREFIANASHELRTPLFSLGGFLELLVDEELDEHTRRDFLFEMRAQVERLGRLATDLLDLSRLDAGQLSVEVATFRLDEPARTASEEFRALAEADGRELRLVVEEAVLARGDEQRVLQIGRILVENALRHTPAGTPVEVRVGARRGRAVLAVRDAGPGIASKDREHLFDRFYRGEGEQASGSGLGLAIGRELAERMEGRLDVESGPGGTTFTLELRLAGVDEGLFSRAAVSFPREMQKRPDPIAGGSEGAAR